MERTNRLDTKALGPVMKTNSPSRVAMVSVICEMYLMPLLTPVSADPVNSRVSTAMTRTCRIGVDSTPRTVLSPCPTCEAPRPSDVVVPKSVAMMVRTSMDRKSTRLNSSHVAISYGVFCLQNNHHD